MARKTGLGTDAFFERRPDRAAPTPSSLEEGPLRQTTILLHDRHLDWLETKMIEARKLGGKPIRKAALIRALLELAMASPLSLVGLVNEKELVERLERAIKSKF
ncbi:MAG: hypothetical protein HYX89_08170 [Chloroflexi bacterium]|nr:hypothetical protein [Chloroflexota bacterium]